MVVIQSAIQCHLQDEMSISLPNACNPVDINDHYTLPGIFTHPQWVLGLMSMGEAIAFH